MNKIAKLRDYDAIHIDETIPVLAGYHENTLFYNCTIGSVQGAHLHNCVLTHSSFDLKSLQDIQGITITLDCHNFENVELSEAAFDYILMLLIKTKGNTEKREKLIAALGGKDILTKLLLQTRRR